MKKILFKTVTDPDIRILIRTSRKLKPKYGDQKNDPWRDSPFAWIKMKPSRQVGKIGEQLIAEWCRIRKLKAGKSPDSEADLVIQNKRVEIKFSTLWRNGSYRFQQIRDQNYEYLICLGLSPFTAHAWILPKKALQGTVIGNPTFSQHRGRKGSDTYWLHVYPQNPPAILRDQSGSLAHVYRILKG